MNPRLLPILLAILILAACRPAPIAETQDSASATSVPPTNTPIPPTDVPPTDIPAPNETTIPQLSARSTFEVIAAMHAYVILTTEYAQKNLSPAEEEAVIAPLIEFGILPLGYLWDQHLPDPGLSDQWEAAASIYRSFLPGSFDLAVLLDEIGPASVKMIDSAVSIAEGLGVDTTQYGPDYTGAIEAANALLPEIAIQPLPESPARGDLNPDLVPAQITPFIFNYAGSNIFYTIGTVENTFDTPQQNVTVEVDYYNFLDEHIGTVRGRLLADIANPSGIYPFIATDVIAGEEEALKDQTRFEAAIYSTPAETESYQGFTFTLTAEKIISGQSLISGQITNTGNQPINSQQVHIGISAYDGDGILIGVGEGSVFPDNNLAPGGTAHFEVIIQALAGEPTTFEFFAEVIEE